MLQGHATDASHRDFSSVPKNRPFKSDKITIRSPSRIARSICEPCRGPPSGRENGVRPGRGAGDRKLARPWGQIRTCLTRR
jgi:hypothetical protein